MRWKAEVVALWALLVLTWLLIMLPCLLLVLLVDALVAPEDAMRNHARRAWLNFRSDYRGTQEITRP